MSDYSFDRDTAVEPLGDGRFGGYLHERWTIGEVPNGGLAMGVMLAAVGEVSQHPDPLTTTAHFLSPTAVGPVEISTEVVKAGRSTTTVVSSLMQGDRERIRMLTTLTDLTKRRGPSHSFLPPRELTPPFERRRSSFMQNFPENFDFQIPEMVAGGVRGEPSGEPHMGGTIAFADGRPPDLAAIPVMADGFAPVAFNLGYQAWTPTIEMTIHFWNHPVPGPVTVWLTTEIVEGGFHDETADLWDADGSLVARSRQLALIL
jgi:acyl-CoA thioesterase